MIDTRYLCGAIVSPADERDYTVCAAAKAQLPPECYLLVMPTIREQQAGNCVAQACRGACETLFEDKFSVGFVYGYRPSGYYTGKGMVAREAAQTITNVGNVKYATFKVEKEMPDASIIVNNNIDKLTKYAAKSIVANYARCFTPDEIKTEIAANNPVIFAAQISQYNVESGNVFPCRSAVHGHHEMLIVGYKNDMFRVANSWGASWGDNGYCWISAADVMRDGDVIAFSTKQNDITITRTLKKGKTGEDVRRLEQKLNEFSGISINADGKFNESTERAVKIVQKRLGLPETGTVGSRTWRALGL